MPGIVENSTGKRQNSDPCIHKEVREELSVWSWLKWGKFLSHAMHWADILIRTILPDVLINGGNTQCQHLQRKQKKLS